MLKKIMITSLAAAMVLAMSLTAFADEEDEDMTEVTAVETDVQTEDAGDADAQAAAVQEVNPAGYNEYGLSYAAMDALTISMDEATSKYPVSEIVPEEDHTTVYFQNGFTMDYYDGWTDLFTDTDEGGKNLFIYFDITQPSVDAVAAILAADGYSVVYDYVETEDLPVNTCAVDSVSQSVKINAGFDAPVFWDINSEGQGQMSVSYSFNDALESADAE